MIFLKEFMNIKKSHRRKRAWKIELIEKNNPQWKDLYETF